MNKGKFARRACTATFASALLIALTSCSGATNKYGNLDKNDVYASAGDYEVTYGDLWNELQWSSKSVLDTQITNVVISDYVNNIRLVLNNDYSALTDDDKEKLGVESAESYSELYDDYSTRIVDYVVQDIYNIAYESDDYYDNVEALESYNKKLLETKYVDEIYTSYQVSTVGTGENQKNISDIVADADVENNFDNYLQIATDSVLRQVYYVNYAKELFALAKLQEEIDEAAEDDDDEDDDMWGYYSTSEYVSKFKSLFTQTNSLDLILVKFKTEDEYTSTLRALGLKIYNGNIYYLADKLGMTYDEYIEYYDDFSNSQLTSNNDVVLVDNDAVLEIYAQIYNYTYGGYRPILVTNNGNTEIDGVKYYTYGNKTITELGLDKLRYLTDVILDDYSTDTVDKYNTAVASLNDAEGVRGYREADADTKTLYTSDELTDLDSSLKGLVYTTLDADIPSKRYSTSTTSASNGYYIAYKYAEEKLTAEDADNYEDLQKYLDFYNSDLSNYEILEYIQEQGLEDTILKELKQERMSESVISTYISDELEDVKVKIYNEACEISYLAANSDYSKTLKSSSNKNLLATIKYNGTTYNLDIVADDSDTKSIKIPGTDSAFGVFDYLEQTTGATTAIDLLSNKVIKETNAYEETNEDRDTYETYIESVLYAFANNQYDTDGYPSSIGKYNFLMLYYHTANIDNIINNYYRVQYASVKLLTDYSDDQLIDFFKTYSDLAYEDYFSLAGTRLNVYFDADDDGKADDVEDWYNNVVTFEGNQVTLEVVAKQLILDVYTLIGASTSSHTDRLSAIVSEIQSSARAEYESNPIVAENRWAKYLHLGLNVTTEEITVTNSTTDIDFNIKQRVYDYARGHNEDNTKTYQYFLNDTTPTCYIEPLNLDETSSTYSGLASVDDIVKSDDGFNLLLITSGTARSSAKWTSDDNDENILTNIYLQYNDEDITISDIYNENDSLNFNQIKLYVIDYAINGSSTLAPADLSSAYSSYLSSVVTRFTGSETQRIILLSFINSKTGNSATELYDVVSFANTEYKGANGVFANYIKINQNIADNYIYIYGDTTGTSDPYTYTDESGNTVNWWTKISEIVNEFLLNDEKESE